MPVKLWRGCYTCMDYRKTRDLGALANALWAKADREGRDVVEVSDEFMMAAHERHLSGKPLREGGPTRVTDPKLGQLAALFAPGLFEGEVDGSDR